MPNKIRSFRAKKKLEVVAYAEAHNISVAAKVFDVDRKTNKRMELTKNSLCLSWATSKSIEKTLDH